MSSRPPPPPQSAVRGSNEGNIDGERTNVIGLAQGGMERSNDCRVTTATNDSLHVAHSLPRIRSHRHRNRRRNFATNETQPWDKWIQKK